MMQLKAKEIAIRERDIEIERLKTTCKLLNTEVIMFNELQNTNKIL